MNLKQATIASLCLKALIFIFIACVVTVKPVAAHTTKKWVAQKNTDDDKKPAKKEKAFKNQTAVKIFPDAIKKAMHVVARSGNKKDIDFLVFDINGNMVLDYKMKAGERKTISDLKKGSYMYHVFADDEYLMTGKIVFR